MPTIPLNILPGIVTETTAKDATPQWKDCNRIMFRNGMPESMNGWRKDNTTILSGKCRALNNWVTLAQDKLIGIGSSKKLYIWRGGAYYDITPLRDSTSAPFSSSALTNPFDTTNLSTTVTVTHTAHGAGVGDTVIFSGATAVGGITISGSYLVVTVPTANTYTITHSAAATSTANGGGTVSYDYEINIGLDINIALGGWGAGTWGAGTWGTPRTTSNIAAAARIWHLDQWGEDLVGNIREGAIYTWDATNGLTTRAILISGAPATARLIIVSPEDRRMIAFGAHDGAANDPLLIRWSTSEDFTQFTPLDTNTAGDKRIDRGTEIVGAVRTRGQILILTDVAAHSMYPSNDDFIFGFDILAEGCGLIAPHALAEDNGITYWMGVKDIFMFDGIVQKMDCSINNHIFDDINLFQKSLFHVKTNRTQNEVIGFYCSASSSEIDRYWKYNITEKTWDYGNIDVTTWVDISEGGGLTVPYAVHTDQYLYQHESGYDAGDEAMGSFIESHDVMLDEQGGFAHIKKWIPDFKTLIGTVDFTVKTKTYPQDENYRIKGPRTVTSTTQRIGLRARGRQVALRIESNNQGDKWRMGKMQAQAIKSGRR